MSAELGVGDLSQFNSLLINKFTLVFGLVLSVFLSDICRAGHSEKPDLSYVFSLSLDELLAFKVNVANQLPTEAYKAPSSVTIFTGHQIRSYGIYTLEQLLTQIPGFQVSRGEEGGGTFSISTRGRRADRGANRDLLILLDGLRLNEPMTTGAMLQERQISLLNVERVEIIRGPGSAVHGANAFLGVINIVTDRDANEVSASVGAFDSK